MAALAPLLVPLAASLAGCAADGAEREALAEEYARRESRRIDETSFRHARDRERLLGVRERAVRAAAPLRIDPAREAGWQFGLLDHPLDGEPACAALSGVGTGDETARLRIAVFADDAWLLGARALATDRLESTLRVDSGLPVPLDPSEVRRPPSEGTEAAPAVRGTGAEGDPGEADDPGGGGAAGAAGGVLATLRVDQTALLERLRRGSLATVTATDAATSEPFERMIPLDGLAPMLDELARCSGSAETD